MFTKCLLKEQANECLTRLITASKEMPKQVKGAPSQPQTLTDTHLCEMDQVLRGILVCSNTDQSHGV